MANTQRTLDNLAIKAKNGAEAGLQSAENAVDRIQEDAKQRMAEWRDEAAPAVNRLTERASGVARSGAQWARESGGRVRDEVTRASDRAVSYARDEPVKSALMAAAAGAVLFALLRMLGSRSQR